MSVLLKRPAVDHRAYWLILAIPLAAMALCAPLLLGYGVPPLRPIALIYNGLLYLLSAVMLLCGELLWRLAKDKPDSPFRYVRDSAWPRQRIDALRRSWPIIAALIVFMPFFSTMKAAIPLFTDYTWDETWIALDRTIHGDDPWRLLMPVLGFPLATAFIALLYHLWILLIYMGSMGLCLYLDDARLKARYFMAFFLCWIVLGVGAATAFASVGPCFLGPMLGIDTFADQMAWLRQADARIPIMVLHVQDTLIEWQRSGAQGLGRGISAMPSMHVSVALLFALVCRQISRPLFIAASVFALLILIGSVHLAYHYAVDGYFAIAGTLAIWWLCGWVEKASSRT